MKKFISKLRSLIEPPSTPVVTQVKTTTKPTSTSKSQAGTNTPEIAATPSIEQHWNHYKEWLSENFSESVGFLNAGVTEDHLVILEKSINNKLPADYRNWLKVHNGQSVESAGLLYGNEFLSVSRLLEIWLAMRKLLDDGEFTQSSKLNPNNAIKPVWWNTNWLPISANGAGNLVCLDLEPGDQGIFGQVIKFDNKKAHRQVLAVSFKDYIAAYLSELEFKTYRYSSDLGALVSHK